jgi:hypothetical protein
MAKIILKILCIGILGAIGWFFGDMFWNIDWENYQYAAMFTRIGLLSEAGVAIAAVCACFYGVYWVIKWM